MLKWPDRARAAIRWLYEPLQDIDVYVEDTDDEPFYRTLLNFATDGEIRVARVIALGGRDAVIEAARLHDQSKRLALFLIDGDLPWVRGDPTPSVVGLHSHSAYCIENLLLCEKALAHVLAQEVVITEIDATSRLGYLQWRNELIQCLAELFAAYATVNEYDSTVPTVSKGVAVLCTQTKFTMLDPAKVSQERDRSLRAAESAADKNTVAMRYNEILARITKFPDPLLAVSGKDFVLPLMHFHFQRLGSKCKRKSLRMRLASSGEANRFSALARALRHAAGGYDRKFRFLTGPVRK
jgi:hypothetical protein